MSKLTARRNQILQELNEQRVAAQLDQENKYDFIYPLNNVSVPQGNITTPANLQIGADADFFINRINGSFEPDTAGEKKVSVRITDQGRGKSLTGGFVGLWLILSPGLLTDQLYHYYKFNYIFSRTSTILFEFINTSTTGDCTVNLALHGKKVLKYS